MPNNVIRVFHLEDNAGDARLVREMLVDINRAAGDSPRIDLDQATRLDQALKTLQRGTFDLALIDLNLPDSQGLDTLTCILNAVPGLPIIVMSGMEDYSLALAAVSAGAQDYLVKSRITDSALDLVIRYTFMSAQPAKTARPLTSDQSEGQPKRELKSRIPWIGWLVDFFLPPLRTDLGALPEAEPGQWPVVERAFTIILRFAAALSPVVTLLSRADLENFPAGYWAFLAIEFCLGILAAARAIPYKVRVIGFLLAFYAFGVLETAAFGYSPESLIFFMIVVVSAGVLTGARGGWSVWFASLVTLGAFGWQMARGDFVPLAMDQGLASSLQSFQPLPILVSFAAGAAGLSIFVTTIWVNMRRALQRERQALNLLQQERDLLEQRVMERSRDIYESEMKYRLLAENASDVIWTMDMNLRFTYISPSVQRLRGYSVEEALEQTLEEMLPPKSFHRASALFLETTNLFLSKTPAQRLEAAHSPENMRTIELENYRKDGSTFWIEITVSFLFDAQGEPAGILGISRDITDRRQAEEQIRKLSQAVEQSPASIVITGKDGDIEYVNPKFEAMTGYSFEEVRGKNSRILKSGEHPPEFYEDLWKTIKEGKVWSGVFCNKGKDGSLFWESATIAPILDENGMAANFVAIKKDITAQKKLEDTLHRSYQTQAVLNSLLNLPLEHETLDEILDRALETILTIPWLSAHPKGGIFLVEDQPGVLVLKSHRNLGAPLLTLCGRVPFGHCLCGRAAASGRIEYADGVDERHENRWDGMQLHGHYHVPILFREEVLGVIVLYLDAGRGRDQHDIEYLEAAANTLAAILHEKRIAEKLRASENRYHTIYNTIDDVIYETDYHGVLTSINPSIEKISGYLPQELIGQKMVEVCANPEEYEILKSVFEAEGAIHDYEIRLKRKGGEVAYVSINAHTLFDTQGKPIGAQGVVRDITDRKQTELRIRRMNQELGRTITERTSELQSSRSFLATMLETAMAVNASLDQDEVLDQILNQARVMLNCRALNVMLIQGEFAYIARRIGYEGLEEIERNLLDMQFPLSWHSFQHMKTTGQSIFIPETAKDPDWQNAKSSEWARSYIGVPLRVGEETLGFLNASHDQPYYFTENHMVVLEGLAQHASIAIQNARLLKELETALESERAARSQLVHADKLAALGKMVAVIAHEINNPIQTIKNTFFLLEDHIQPDNPARNFLDIASAETRRIAELVSQLRETYRVRSKTFARMNLLDLLTDVKTVLGPQLKKNNVEWSQPHEFQPCAVFGVRNNLKQVFINLGQNAIEAMEENNGGKLTIELRLDRDGGRIGAAMRNTGPLIPPEALSHLFEPFYTTKKIGTGLGLSISYDIVQQHQGEITVENNPENGVIFTVWLPLAPGEAGTA